MSKTYLGRPCKTGPHHADGEHCERRTSNGACIERTRANDRDRHARNRNKEKARQREYDAKNRDKAANRKRKYRQSLHGIVSGINSYAKRRGYSPITTPEDEILWPKPDLCQCCGRKCGTGHRLCLDHCHKTGEVRAWLCHSCNTGHLGKLTHEQALLWVRIMYEGYRPAWTGTGPA